MLLLETENILGIHEIIELDLFDAKEMLLLSQLEEQWVYSWQNV